MGLKPKNKGHANFYECCDLTKKVYLMWTQFINRCSRRKRKAIHENWWLHISRQITFWFFFPKGRRKKLTLIHLGHPIVVLVRSTHMYIWRTIGQRVQTLNRGNSKNMWKNNVINPKILPFLKMCKYTSKNSWFFSSELLSLSMAQFLQYSTRHLSSF